MLLSGFYRATRMHSTDYAVATCPSVCPSVCLSVCHTPIFCLNGNTYPQSFSLSGIPTILHRVRKKRTDGHNFDNFKQLIIIFSMTLNDPTHSFKLTPFWRWISQNGTGYGHIFNEILIGTYTRPAQQCYFEWPWVTLGDLEKYSITQSVARSLWDS